MMNNIFNKHWETLLSVNEKPNKLKTSYCETPDTILKILMKRTTKTYYFQCITELVIIRIISKV